MEEKLINIISIPKDVLFFTFIKSGLIYILQAYN